MTNEINETPFPTDPNLRVEAFVNGVLNHEIKGLALWHSDDTPREAKEIRSRLRETTGQGYLPDPKSIQAYFHHSLLPIGAVAEETIVRSTGQGTYFGYSSTEAGRRYCLPLLAFNLDYVVSNNMSMHSVFGSSNTRPGNSRAPLNRIRLLQTLSTGECGVKELSETIGLSITAIDGALEDLDGVGFLRNERAKDEQIPYVYSWIDGKNPEQVQPISGYNGLVRAIASRLAENRSLGLEEIKKTPGYSETTGYSSILTGLIEQGFVTRGKWRGDEDKSRIILLDRGKRFLEDYVSQLYAVANDDFQKVSVFLDRYSSNLDLFRTHSRIAIDLYSSISPHINTRPKTLINEQIIAYLEDHPGDKAENIGRALNLKQPHHYLVPLQKSGAVRKEKCQRGVYSYFII